MAAIRQTKSATGGGVGGRIGYHMGHMAVTREHISLCFGNNTASLLWPSGGHFVCLMTAILYIDCLKLCLPVTGAYI